MAGQHHRLNGPASEQPPGDRDGREAWPAAVPGAAEPGAAQRLDGGNQELNASDMSSPPSCS